MSQKTYAMVTGLVFLAVTVLHALRLLYGWNAAIAGWVVPMWLSGAAVVVSAYLAYHGFRLSK
ncbi:hypothetical protein HYT33_01565 [Candidatus Roizmanbacteria bacterium]|nr:hypothetical protein [Candidatus Roizmanbacteria bacterium]